MSDWSDMGFPQPDSSSYGYDVDAGLLRTKFGAAKPRQTRAYETGKRTFTITVTFDYVLLTDIETFLYERGFNWFTIDLVSGEDTSVMEPICVRLIEFYTVTNKGDGVYQVSFKAEQKIHRSYYATSVLYPLENFEYAASVAPAPMSTHFWEQVRYLGDYTSSLAPTIVSSTLGKTVFYCGPLLPGPFPWNYEGFGWSPNSDLDAAIALVPDVQCSLYPFLLKENYTLDESSSACPELSGITNIRTMFHVYVFQDDTARCDKAAAINPAAPLMSLEHTMFPIYWSGQEASQSLAPELNLLSLWQTLFIIQQAQTGDLRADLAATSSPFLGAFSIRRDVIRNTMTEMAVAGSPSTPALSLTLAVNKPTLVLDLAGSLSPGVRSAVLLDTVHRLRTVYDDARTVSPSIGSMTLTYAPKVLNTTFDFSVASAPSFGSFILTDHRGQIRVTVLRSESGSPVAGAKVEIT